MQHLDLGACVPNEEHVQKLMKKRDEVNNVPCILEKVQSGKDLGKRKNQSLIHGLVEDYPNLLASECSFTQALLRFDIFSEGKLYFYKLLLKSKLCMLVVNKRNGFQKQWS